MVENPPAGTQRIVPHVIYSDAAKALEFLCSAFGFEQLFRYDMPDGRVGHAEIGYGGNRVMLASEFPEIGMLSPRQLPARHGQILCYVDDVDAHYAHAVAAGATVAGEPVDKPYGDRSYEAVDLDGHHWTFATHTRDVVWP